MDAETIDHALRTDICCKKYYRGTLCCDELPKLRLNDLWLVNLSLKSDPIGSHWVVLTSIPSKEYSVALCCSAGSQIHENTYIKNRILEYSSDTYCFDRPLQDPDDTACGAISLLVCYLLSRHVSAVDILNKFYSKVSEKAYIRDLFSCYVVFNLFHIKRGTVTSMFLDPEFLQKLKNAKKITRKKSKKKNLH